jgi:hypothetical protein
MAMLTEFGLRKLIKEELRKTLKEAIHQPEGLSKLTTFLQKLKTVDIKLADQLSSIMLNKNISPTDGVSFGDYHDGGDLDIYTREGGFIGRIPRNLANKLGIAK